MNLSMGASLLAVAKSIYYSTCMKEELRNKGVWFLLTESNKFYH